MNEQYKALLSTLFDELDLDKSGFLDVKSFMLLGLVMTGQPVTSSEATVQLEKADLDRDGLVSREDWLRFSTILLKLDEYMFTKLIKGYTDGVRKHKDIQKQQFSSPLHAEKY